MGSDIKNLLAGYLRLRFRSKLFELPHDHVLLTASFFNGGRQDLGGLLPSPTMREYQSLPISRTYWFTEILVEKGLETFNFSTLSKQTLCSIKG